MNNRRSGNNLFLLIAVSMATVVAIVVFAFLFFVVFPMNGVIAAGYPENVTSPIHGYPVDPLVEKVGEIENAYYNQAKAMINGTYRK